MDQTNSEHLMHDMRLRVTDIERLQRENAAIRKCIERAETGIDPREDTADWLAQVLQFLVCDANSAKILEAKLAAAEAALESMCAEFRGYDLPYGSKAYHQATEYFVTVKHEAIDAAKTGVKR